MSFLELEADQMLLDTAFSRGGGLGRKSVSMAIGRLDHSWAVLERTTASVMYVAVAAVSAEVHADVRTLLNGMLVLMKIMSDSVCMPLGALSGDMPDKSVMECNAQEIDKAGKDLCDKLDSLGGIVITQLLVTLPSMWFTHFKLLGDTCGIVSKELNSEDTIFMTRLLASEQSKLTYGLADAVARVLEEGSAMEMVQAGKWVDQVRKTGLANRTLVKKDDLSEVMVSIIRKCGFPDLWRVE